MATVTPGSMAGNNVTAARTDITAADADYSGDTLASAVDCGGLAKILIVANRTAGTSSITIQPCLHSVLARDAAGAPTSTVLSKGDTVSLSDGGTFVLDVGGRAHSLHVLGVDAGSTWDLYVGAWEAFNTDSRRVG